MWSWVRGELSEHGKRCNTLQPWDIIRASAVGGVPASASGVVSWNDAIVSYGSFRYIERDSIAGTDGYRGIQRWSPAVVSSDI